MQVDRIIDVGSDYSGIGAFDQALRRLKLKHKNNYACDMDKFARRTYVNNYGTKNDLKILDSDDCRRIDDVYYNGIVNTKLVPPTKEDWKFVSENEERVASLFSFYYPWNVYSRTQRKSLDIYMTSPPCQAFSLAGKRKGEDDEKGILFYNSHEFIEKNNPRFFIFENVKGLLSDAKGRTFQVWLDMLGGKSVNGNPVIFPREDSVPYHIYHKVINAKHHGIPQNRERVFIIGIRDDEDNVFNWPKPFHLTKTLKDVLEQEVDSKYYLSDRMIEGFVQKKENGFNGTFVPKTKKDIHANCITTNAGSRVTDNFVYDCGFINQDTQASKVHSKGKESPTISAGTHGYANGYIKVNSATKKGCELEKEGDSINLSQPSSKTRKGRVGKNVAQTLDTDCNQAVMIAHVSRSEEGKRLRKESMAKGKDFTPFQAKQVTFKESDVMNCITTATTKDNLIKIGAIREQNPDNPKSRIAGMTTKQNLEINLNGTSNTLTTVQKDNVVVGEYSIRRLTPTECLRLMGFPDDLKKVCSDSQLYKQAGNSIVVEVLMELIKKLKL